MNIAIVGSRQFPDLPLVDRFVAGMPMDAVIISGGAPGVDQRAVKSAQRRGLRTMVIPADWKKWGKIAGFRRNTELVKTSDIIYAFWDGVSGGTADTIRKAERWGKCVIVIQKLHS